MEYTYKNIWLINFPVMMSILIEQLINITDAIFLGHVGEVELGASAIAGIWYLALYMLGFGFSLGLQVFPVLIGRSGHKLLGLVPHLLQLLVIIPQVYQTRSSSRNIAFIFSSRSLSHSLNSIIQLGIVLSLNILPVTECRQIQHLSTQASNSAIVNRGLTAIVVISFARAASQHGDSHDTGQHQGSNFLELHSEFFLLMVYKR